MIADFEPRRPGLQYVTDDEWISELGIRYQLGDRRPQPVPGRADRARLGARHGRCGVPRERPPEAVLLPHRRSAETAVLGAFLAQDLALFVVFFDLMLVPFYFLIGGWGSGERVRATTKFVIYTLVGLAADARRRGGARRAVDAARAARSRSRSPSCSSARSRRARSSGSSCCSRSPSSSRRRCSRSTAGWSTPTARRRSCCSRCSAGAVEGRRLRLPADRAADHARGAAHFQDLMIVAGGVLDPLRLGARLLAGQAAAGASPTRRSPSSASSRWGSSRSTTRAPRAR